MSIRILLAIDPGIVYEGVKVLIGAEKNLKIAGSAFDCNELASALTKTAAGVVLLDADALLMNAFECAEIIRKGFPGTKILVMAMLMNERQMTRYFDAGADGFILKNTTKEELIFAIEKIASDGIYIGPEFTVNFFTKNRHKKTHADKPASRILTDREMQVLELIVQGKTNAEMAEKLFISVRTIETRRKKILEKTGTVNTATLVKYAIQHGLIS